MVKQVGYRTQLLVSTGTTGSSYLSLGHLISLPGPDATRPSVDTSTIDTTGYSEFQSGGSMDPGEMALTMAFDASDVGQALLPTLAAKGHPVKWQLIYPTTTLSSTMTGFIMGLGRAIDGKDSLITRTVTVKLSGDPDF